MSDEEQNHCSLIMFSYGTREESSLCREGGYGTCELMVAGKQRNSVSVFAGREQKPLCVHSVRLSCVLQGKQWETTRVDQFGGHFLGHGASLHSLRPWPARALWVEDPFDVA